MANTLMTRDEVREEIELPLLQAIRKDLLDYAEFGQAFAVSGVGDCMGAIIDVPQTKEEFEKWRSAIRVDFDNDMPRIRDPRLRKILQSDIPENGMESVGQNSPEAKP